MVSWWFNLKWITSPSRSINTCWQVSVFDEEGKQIFYNESVFPSMGGYKRKYKNLPPGFIYLIVDIPSPVRLWYFTNPEFSIFYICDNKDICSTNDVNDFIKKLNQ